MRNGKRERKAGSPGPLRRAVRIGNFCVFLCLVILSAMSVRRLVTRASERQGEYAVQALRTALKRDVRLGSLDVRHNGDIRIRDLAIAAGPTFADGVLFSVKEARIRYRLKDVLQRRVDPIGGIARISLDSPRLLIIRSADNRFNLQEIFRKRRKAPKPSPFRGLVTLTDARIHYVDYAVRDLVSPQSNDIVAPAASLDASAPPLWRVRAAGRGDGRIVTNVDGVGRITPEDGSFSFKIRAGTKSAAYWQRYFARLNGVSVSGGSGLATINVWKPGARSKVAAAITVDAKDASATTNMLVAPITGATGRLSFVFARPACIALDLGGNAGDMPVRLNGTIISGKPARLALKAASDAVTLRSLTRLVPKYKTPSWLALNGSASAAADIFGPASDVSAAGEVKASNVKLYERQVRNLTADFEYRNRMVRIPSARGMAGDGPLSASGVFDTRSGVYRFSAGGRGLPLNRLLPETERLAGRVSATAVVSGRGASPDIRLDLAAGPGRFRGIPYQRASVQAHLVGRKVRLTDASVVMPGAIVTATGTAGMDGTLSMQVQSRGADLGKLLPELRMKDISGTASVNSRVAGTLSDPKVEFHAQILDAVVRNQKLDFVVGDGLYRRKVVQITSGTVARYPSQGVFAGKATLGGKGGANLDFTARLLTGRLEKMLADARVKVDAEGDIRTPEAVRIRGTLASPNIRGTARVTNALVAGYPVKSAVAGFYYSEGLVEATGLEVVAGFDSDGAPAYVSAPVLRLKGETLEAPEGFRASGINLAGFNSPGASYVKLGGVARVTNGTLSGTRREPLITAPFTIDGLTINSIPYTCSTAAASFNGSALAVTGLKLENSSQGVIDVPSVKWNQETQSMSGDLRVSAFRVEDARSLLERSAWYFTKAADGLRGGLQSIPQQSEHAFLTIGGGLDKPDSTLHFAGNLERFSVNGHVALSDLLLGEEPLDRIAIGANVQNLQVKKGRLVGGTIADGDGILTAETKEMSVTGNLSGAVGRDIVASLDAINVPLGYLKTFVPSLRNADYIPKGNVTITVNAEGSAGAPNVVASVKGTDIKVGKIRVPLTISTGEVALTNEGDGATISAQSIRVQAKDHKVTMQGSVPFSWKPLGIPRDAPIQFTADAKEQNLNILELAFGGEQQGPVTSATGILTAHVGIDGTLAAWKASGFARVEDGSVKLRPLHSALEKINASVTFDPVAKQLNIENLSLRSSSGGGAETKPGSVVRQVTDSDGTYLVPDISLALNDLNIDEVANGFNFGGERFRGTFTTSPQAPLRISGGAAGPHLSGTVTLTNVDLLPPNQTRPAMEPPNGSSTVPTFDLTLVAGKNVRVGNALYRLIVDDKRPAAERRLRITGNPADLAVEGRFTSREGVFNYPTARFRLTDGVVGVRYPAVQGQYSGARAPVSAEDRRLAESAPVLSLTANAQAKLTAVVNNRREPVTVYLHVEGPSSQNAATPGTGAFQTLAPYRITLRSSPSLPERQLVALISREEALQALAGGTSTPEQVLRQETLNILQTSVLPGALESVESRLGSAFGLELLSVDYMAMDRAVSVTASKRLGNRLLLTYTRPMGAQVSTGDAYTVALSYDVAGQLRLTLQRRKGPLLFGSQATAVATGSTNVVETQLLLEGSRAF